MAAIHPPPRLLPTRPTAVPKRSTATPSPRSAIQPGGLPPSRAQQPIWLRLREVRDEEAPHSRKVRPRAQRQPNTSPNQQLRRAGLPRRQTSTQPRVCKTGTVDAVRQHQIARPGVGGARAVRVQQAGVKTDHSRPRQIGPRSVDGGSVSDSQADSAGSIPVTRSTREKCCSTIELEDSSFLLIRVFSPCSGHYGPHISTVQDSSFSFTRRSAYSVMFSACSVPRSSNVTQGVSPQVRARCERAQLHRREESPPVIPCAHRRVKH